jgi:signal transduction histidine kinase
VIRLPRFLHVTFLVLIFQCPAFSQAVTKGYADLSTHDFLVQGPVDLSGSWNFLWNELQPRFAPDSATWTQVQVPGSWHRQGPYEVLGFATYHVRLKLPPRHSGLSIYFPIINSAARVFVNGKLVQQTGQVSKERENYESKLLSTLVTIPSGEELIDLVVHVANYTYFSGGIAGQPHIDLSTSLFARINRNNGIENIFAGSLLAMFIYQLILYFLYHRGKPFLWLALICLGVALRALIVHGGSFMLPNLYPMISWEFWKKIEFGSVYAIVALFPLYVRHLFPDQAPRRPIIFFVSMALVLCLGVLITPQYVYGRLLEICHVSLLLAFVYAIYSISRSWMEGNEDARTILFGVLASFPFILAEIMKNSRFFPVDISFMYLVELGVLVFLLFQVYLLANHYAKSYKHLEIMNHDLERMVEERTGELITANRVKDRLLSVMSHDIKSPLNSLHGILQIFNKGAIDQQEFVQYTKHIEGDLSKTSILVENILFWTASQLKGVTVKRENFLTETLIDENLHLFQTIAANKNISLVRRGPEGVLVHSDRHILNLVIRNLISNAIKFSFKDSVIELVISDEADRVIVTVKDHGMGMSQATIESLMNPETTVSSTGTRNEQGTGLGLALCREYLELVDCSLTIESKEGSGSSFAILIPK